MFPLPVPDGRLVSNVELAADGRIIQVSSGSM